MYQIIPQKEPTEPAQLVESSTAVEREKFPARFLVAYGKFLFRYRNIGFPIVAILFLVVFEPDQSRTAFHEILTDLIGVALVAVGQAIHIGTLGTAWIRRGGHNNEIHADRLLTSCWYAHCRNPIYIGNLLIITGLLVVFNNIIVSAIVFVGIVFSYHAIVITEENYLTHHFGVEYESYCRRVPRWWPNFKNLLTTARSASISWRWVIAKSYTSTYSWVVMLVLILTYKAWLFRKLGAMPENIGLVSAFSGCSLLFLLARWLKKRSNVLATDPKQRTAG